MILSVDMIEKLFNTKCDGIRNKNERITEVSTDSRNLKQGALFIPLKGENFDGHNYIDTAFEKGALLTLSEKNVAYPHILVENTKAAYRALAAYYKTLVDPIAIGITGSVGKTTTKEIIASVLKEKYKIHHTYKNYNNEIGVAKTILSMKPEHEVLVIELGMDHPGEMHLLSQMVKPDYAVITNIGMSHASNFETLDGIAKAKYEIFDFLKDDGVAIVNSDDRSIMAKTDEISQKIITFGFDNSPNAKTTTVKSNGIFGMEITVATENSDYQLKTKAIGDHLGYSILPSILLGEALGVTSEDIVKGIQSYGSTDKRMELIDYNDITFINDCYNASKKSIISAIDTINHTKTHRRKILFLGDILELGKHSKKVHQEIGEYLKDKAFDQVVFLGPEMKHAYKVLKANSNVFHYMNHQRLKENVMSHIKDEDIILLKGSRGMTMEKIMDYVKEVKEIHE